MITESHFMDAQDSICDDYATGVLSLEEAIEALTRMGMDTYEASTLLQEYEAPDDLEMLQIDAERATQRYEEAKRKHNGA